MKLPPVADKRWLQLVIVLSAGFTAAIAVRDLVFALEVTPMPPTGAVLLADAAPGLALADLGAGPDKKLLVFNLTALGPGGSTNIHDDDKRGAHAQFWRNGVVEDEFPIGIEIKGGRADRDKLNFGFELLDEPGGDDTNERVFGFAEKVSDYVLRGGFFEPTLSRDAFAPTMGAGPAYDTALCEVVFVGEGPTNDRTTYEGLYVLLPAPHKRRALEKYADWSSKGKKPDCAALDADAGTTAASLADEVATVGFVFQIDVWKYDNKDTDDLCVPTRRDVEVEYPGCSFYVENATKNGACVAATAAERDRLAALLYPRRSAPLSPEVEASLDALVQTFVVEMLLLDEGFGTESDFWAFAPQADAAALRTLSVVLYDHDDLTWRLEDPTHVRLDIPTRWAGKDVLPLWEQLSKNATFLTRVRTDGPGYLDTAEAAVLAVLDARLGEAYTGYWNRSNARWPIFGEQIRARIDPEFIWTYESDKVRSKPSFVEEVEHQRDWIRKRAHAMRAAMLVNSTDPAELPRVDADAPRPTWVAVTLGRLASLAVSLLLLVGLLLAYALIYGCHGAAQSPEDADSGPEKL